MNTDGQQADWHKIAGEPVRIERVGNSRFAYGSETAAKNLRNHFGRGIAEYTAVYDCWFYSEYDPEKAIPTNVDSSHFE